MGTARAAAATPAHHHGQQSGVAAGEAAQIHQHRIGAVQKSIEGGFPAVGMAAELMHPPAAVVVGLVLEVALQRVDGGLSI